MNKSKAYLKDVKGMLMTLFQITYQYIKKKGCGSQLEPCSSLSVVVIRVFSWTLYLHEFHCDTCAWRGSKNLLLKLEGSRM